MVVQNYLTLQRMEEFEYLNNLSVEISQDFLLLLLATEYWQKDRDTSNSAVFL